MSIVSTIGESGHRYTSRCSARAAHSPCRIPSHRSCARSAALTRMRRPTTVTGGGGFLKAAGGFHPLGSVPLEVCATQHASGVGAAMLGAVAAGAFAGLDEAARNLAQEPAKTVQPRDAHRATYDALFTQYLRLVDLFGRDPESPLKQLRALRPR